MIGMVLTIVPLEEALPVAEITQNPLSILAVTRTGTFLLIDSAPQLLHMTITTEFLN